MKRMTEYEYYKTKGVLYFLVGVLVGMVLVYLMLIVSIDVFVMKILDNFPIDNVNINFDLNETELVEAMNNTFNAEFLKESGK